MIGPVQSHYHEAVVVFFVKRITETCEILERDKPSDKDRLDVHPGAVPQLHVCT